LGNLHLSTTPRNPLPDIEIGDPQGALALATAVVSDLILINYCILVTPLIGRILERSLSLYHDDCLEWNKGTLCLKAAQGNADQKTRKSEGKLKKSLKYDFSSTNWGEATDRWLKGVKEQSTSLFPDISKQASILASIKVKSGGTGAESLSSESGLDSSRHDLDSDYEGHRKGADDNHPNRDDADGDTGAGNHRGNGG
jgi:hypothetical protein